MTISNEKWNKLREELQQHKIEESDIKEVFCLAGGKGGQKVNKTEVEVQLSFKQFKVKCSQSRSREDNRYFARKLLIEKVRQDKGEKTKIMTKIAKKIKQKKRRKRKSNEKYLT